MTKREFLEKLRAALGNDLSGSIIQENVDYYNSYISEEVAKGRKEEEVIAELGDPWVIAQTIIDSATAQSYTESVRSEGTGSDYERNPGTPGGFKKFLFILGIIGIVMVLFMVLGGIMALVMRFIVPILIIVLIFRVLGNKRN